MKWFEQWMKDEQKWMGQQQIVELILDERHLDYVENVNHEVLIIYPQGVHLFREMKVKAQNLADLNRQMTQS